MANLTDSRKGTKIQILKRLLPFSFWPMARVGRKRYGLQPQVFVNDPWVYIKDQILRTYEHKRREESLAYVDQAKSFFDAAITTDLLAARPLLMYYSFMNLAKAFVLKKSNFLSFGETRHGLTLRTGSFLNGAKLGSYPSSSSGQTSQYQVFAEFLHAMSGKSMTKKSEFDPANIAPQVVLGHRLWASVAKKPERAERFVAIERFDFMEDSSNHTIWLNLLIRTDDLTRLNLSIKRVLQESLLDKDFEQVKATTEDKGQGLVLLEMKSPIHYSGRSADKIPDLIGKVKSKLWAMVMSGPPYRKYYLYLSPAGERDDLLPQLLAIYALMFSLGSITRYRPQEFEKVMSDRFGGFLHEFYQTQPIQFVYLMASEFAERDVSKPAIV